MSNQEFDLSHFIGKHILTGVDTDSIDGASALRFTLDGVTYLAQENPDDGYRSMLGSIQLSDKPTKNNFPPCEVICKWVEQDSLIEFTDTTTNEAVMVLGTDWSDDYYPLSNLYFYSPAMAINKI